MASKRNVVHTFEQDPISKYFLPDGRPFPGLLTMGNGEHEFHPAPNGLYVKINYWEGGPGQLGKIVSACRPHEVAFSYLSRPRGVDTVSFCALIESLQNDLVGSRQFLRKLAALDEFESAEAKFNLRPQSLAEMPTVFRNIASDIEIERESDFFPGSLPERELLQVTERFDHVIQAAIHDRSALLTQTPKEFEEIVATIFKVHGFDADVRGGPNDHGIDVIATLRTPATRKRSDNQHVSVGIQVKRYAATTKVRERHLRDFFGSLDLEGLPRGVLVTTSTVTSAANSYYHARPSLRDKVTLIQGDDIVEILISYVRIRGQSLSIARPPEANVADTPLSLLREYLKRRHGFSDVEADEPPPSGSPLHAFEAGWLAGIGDAGAAELRRLKRRLLD